MDIKSLQCFIAAAEHLNFSKAAQSLYISQPSLSIRISALEDELGTELFHRTHQQVYLTNAGAAMLPVAREILEKIYSLPFVVKDVQKDAPEPLKLRIGIDLTEDRSVPVITNAFTRFQKRYPEIDMEVSNVSIDEYEKKLLSNDQDFCLMVMQDGMPLNSLFLSIPLLREPMVIVTTDAAGKTVEELVRTREVQLLDDRTRNTRWNDQYLTFLRKMLPTVKPTYVENAAVLCMNLQYGGVMTFLPLTYAQTIDSDRVSILPEELPNCNITLTLIWNKLNINPAIQLMINEFGKEPQTDTES